MKTTAISPLICSLLAAFTVFVSASDDSTLETRMDAFLAPYVQMGSFAGVVLIGRGDSVVFVKGYGMADLDHGIANTVDTRFPLGSIGKQLTAVAIMQLAEAGKLRLDENLERFFPKYRHADEITIHNLLTHGSGIPDLPETTPYRSSGSDAVLTSDQRIEQLNKMKLDFEPGKGYRYTNIAFWLLAEIVEKASGQTHNDYLREHVIGPAGMQHTDFDLGLPIENMAVGYIQSHQGPVKSWYFEKPIAGAIFVTAEDLFRFTRGVVDGRLVSPASRDRMFTAQNQNYGYAWFIIEQKIGKVVWHGGNSIGYRAQVASHLYNDMTVIVFTNRFTCPFRNVFNGVTQIAAGNPVATPTVRQFVDVDPKSLESLAGTFKDEEDTILSFVNQPSGLFMDVIIKAKNLGSTLRNRYVLLPMGGNRFYSMDSDAEILFIREGNDRPERAQFIDASGTTELKRFRDRSREMGDITGRGDSRDDDFERPLPNK